MYILAVLALKHAKLICYRFAINMPAIIVLHATKDDTTVVESKEQAADEAGTKQQAVMVAEEAFTPGAFICS